MTTVPHLNMSNLRMDSDELRLLVFKENYSKNLGEDYTDLNPNEDYKMYVDLTATINYNPKLSDDKCMLYLLFMRENKLINYESFKSKINEFRNNNLDHFYQSRKTINLKYEDGIKVRFSDISLINAWESCLVNAPIKRLDLSVVFNFYKMIYVGKSANYVFNIVMGIYILPFVKKTIIEKTYYYKYFRTEPLLSYNKKEYYIIDGNTTIKDVLLNDEEYEKFILEMNFLFDRYRPKPESYWKGLSERIKMIDFPETMALDQKYTKTVREIIEKNDI